MKSMKKLMLASLALLAVMMVILPLVGCDTNAGSSSTLNTGTTGGNTGDNGNGSDNSGNNGSDSSSGNAGGETIVFKTAPDYSFSLTFTFNTKEGTVVVAHPIDGNKYGTYTGNLNQDGTITMIVNDDSGQTRGITTIIGTISESGKKLTAELPEIGETVLIREDTSDSGNTSENDSVLENQKHTVKFAKGYNTEYEGDLPADLTVETDTVLTTEQLKPLADTEKYVFAGWYDGETEAVAGTYKVTQDVTLTAQWNIIINVTQDNVAQTFNKVKSYAGSMLILESDITVSETIRIEAGNVTLDLNGKTIKNESNTVSVFRVAEAATLTIIDNAGGGYISGSSEYGVVVNKGTLTVREGSISASGETCLAVENWGTLTVTGGSISAIGAESVGVGNQGTLTVTGGSISASGVDGDVQDEYGNPVYSYGVSNVGSMIVTGGRISASGKRCYGVSGNGPLTVKGGSISVSGTNSIGVYYSGGFGSMIVEDGNISASGASSSGVSSGVGILTVTGGTIRGEYSGVSVFGNGTLYLSGSPVITSTGNDASYDLSVGKSITLVGDLTGTDTYSVDWRWLKSEKTLFVVGGSLLSGGENYTLTDDVAKKFTFTDMSGVAFEVELDTEQNALVQKSSE